MSKKIFVTIIALSTSLVVQAQSKLFRSFDNKAHLSQYVGEVWYSFKQAVRAHGSKAGDTIVINVVNKPNMVSMNRDSMFVPLYKDLPPFLTQTLTRWQENNAVAGREMFDATFNWFTIPHELAHYQQFYNKKLSATDFYYNENMANQIAVAFWMLQGQEKKLIRINELFTTALKNIKNPVPAGADAKQWFSDNYSKLSTDPDGYTYVQLSMIVDAIAKRNKLNFSTLIN